MEAKQPVVIEGYFSDQDVATMLRYPTKIQKLSALSYMMGAFGYATSVEADSMSMDNPICKLTGDPDDDQSILKITEAVLEVKLEMEKFFKLEMSMTNCNYANLLTGGFNPMHSDSSQLDGTPYHENEETEYSALVYLNDSGVDYTGGNIVFPLQETVISPKKGMVVFFKGDYHHPHEVEVVTSGERKALVLFFGRKGNVSSRPLFSDEHSGVPTPAAE